MDSTALEKVYYAYIRTGRRLAGLPGEGQAVHLAANKGVVPARLSEVAIVAVPDDPQTGKPFEYAVVPMVSPSPRPRPMAKPLTPGTVFGTMSSAKEAIVAKWQTLPGGFSR